MILRENFIWRRNEKKKNNLKSDLKQKKTLGKLLPQVPVLILTWILETDREADPDQSKFRGIFL